MGIEAGPVRQFVRSKANPMTQNMTLTEPVYCRAEAYQYFVEQMPVLWTSQGLLRAAIAVSMHALDDAVPARIEEHIGRTSARVREVADGDEPSDIRAALHQVLFDELEFGGESDKYYHALNSYIGAVLS